MSGPRLSIIPADAICDARLKDSDLRTLLMIGTHTDRQGWCEVNQRKIGERLGVSRETVNRAIGRLVDVGYLERFGQKAKGKNLCLYRVRLDRGEPGEAAISIFDSPADGASQLAAGVVTVRSQPGDGVVTPRSQPCDTTLTTGGGVVTPESQPVVISRGSQHNDPISNDKKNEMSVAHATDAVPPKVGKPKSITAKVRDPVSRRVYPAEFEAFWKAYPSHLNPNMSKLKAYEAWGHVPAEDRPLAIEAAGKYAAECKAEKRERRLILHAATFLNQERYAGYAVTSPVLEPGEKEVEIGGRKVREGVVIHHLVTYAKTRTWSERLREIFGDPPPSPFCRIPKEIIERARSVAKAQMNIEARQMVAA